MEGSISNFHIFLDVFEFFAFWMIFSVFFFKSGFGVFLVHPSVVFVLLSASVDGCFGSRLRDLFLIKFYLQFSLLKFWKEQNNQREKNHPYFKNK